MGHPPLENLLPKSNWSVYKLSRLAAKRAAELASGKKPLIQTGPIDKTATIALEEIKDGMVVLDEVEDQFQPQKEPQEQVSQEVKEEAE